MATIWYGDFEITGDDETIRTYLQGIQAILRSGETKLVRFAVPDSTDEVVVTVGPGIPLRAVVAREEGVRPIGVPLDRKKGSRGRIAIVSN